MSSLKRSKGSVAPVALLAVSAALALAGTGALSPTDARAQVVALQVSAQGGGDVLVSGLNQVNHVLVDETSVYWTEVAKNRVSIRKAPLAGGDATTLYSEPAKDNSGLAISYLQLKQNANTIFWSRQSVGYYAHYAILSVPKTGGARTVVMGVDASVTPMLADKWAVTDTYVAAVLADARVVGLGKKVRVGRYDLASKEWTPILNNRFAATDTQILAATADSVYVRGINEDADTEIGRITVGPPAGTFQVLDSTSGREGAIDESAATDGTNIYFWNRTGGRTPRLRSLPLAGGTITTLYSTDLGKGLTASGGDLFWFRQGKIVRGSSSGAPTQTVAQNVVKTSALGGVSVDSNSVYFVVKQGSKFQIRVAARAFSD